ncbi:hypothetical protein LVB77_14585 [Lysobacter sp. 5GHs7-4]|uniref:hypothetical protein n=1 Tax=Lysobacter sp. 5GHs7-4 TaxID=2904253 RepID=UPI001E535076|nr:hypothetical protein [Lysobacter sp. 5GHs7-4]UHQ21893.1 hypothetical protein LVB77_14585 [Lysobacter sp. 5GHs7-4]
MRCELLLSDEAMADRGRKMLEAMAAAAPAAGIDLVVSKKWSRAAPVLMTYGLGHPARREWTRKHVAAGGRLIGWDLGYWDRDTPLRFHMRLTLDAEHPHRWIQPEPAERFDASGIVLREDADPSGPIVLCGLGAKQRKHKGYTGQAWELRTLARLRKRFGRGRIVYRPKRPEQGLPGCPVWNGQLEDVLRGAALLVCSHSNTAVDACIAGVPVECEDGAALALYCGNPYPSREQRLEFLRSLAWWQWKPTEAAAAWAFIRQKLCA